MGIIIRRGVFWVICSTENETRVANGVPSFVIACVALLSVMTIKVRFW